MKYFIRTRCINNIHCTVLKYHLLHVGNFLEAKYFGDQCIFLGKAKGNKLYNDGLKCIDFRCYAFLSMLVTCVKYAKCSQLWHAKFTKMK